MDTRTSEQLMVAYQDGEEAAFTALYERYSGDMIRWITHLLKRFGNGLYDDAPDLMQDTFIYLCTHRDSFIPGTHFKTWLIAIARRLTANHVRNATRKQRDYRRTSRLCLSPRHIINDDEGDDARDFVELDNILALDAPVVVDAAAKKDADRERLEGGLQYLPETHQQVIRSIYFDGQTAEETARQMNEPVTTINWWKKEALRKLREVVEPINNDDSGKHPSRTVRHRHHAVGQMG